MEALTKASTKAVDSAQRFLEKDNNAVLTLGGAAAIVALIALKKKASPKRDGKDFDDLVTGSTRMLNNSDSVVKKDEVKDVVDGYENLFKNENNTSGDAIKTRQTEYQKMVNSFYNLVTDFYEWGWGQSFHFGPRWRNEEFMESIKRAEYHLCSRLGMKPGVKALDVGCGVGGPMRHMAIFSEASIEGITINQYQVNVGNKYNKQMGLDHICHLNQGDFQKLPWDAGHFDVAYAIEATCHSPDKVQTFSEVARVLKKGGRFAGYEWVVCDNYDPSNARHVEIKEGIEVGNGLPTLATPEQVVEALEKAGFKVLEHYNANRGQHSPHQIPWYATLDGSYTLKGFRMTRLGRITTHALVSTLEFLRIAPKGSKDVSRILNATALDLVDGGKMEIFTPSYYFLAEKL
ncbi:unnamed protein product [Heterosigma akashiwo]